MTEKQQPLDQPYTIDPARARITTPAPLDLFWSYRKRQPTPLNWLMAARAAVVWRSRPGLRALPIYIRLLGWLVRFPPDIVRFMARYGSIWKRRFGRSYFQQAVDQVVIATSNALMPRDYYGCDIAQMDRRESFFSVIPYQLYATPFLVISAAKGAKHIESVGNKWDFDKFFGDTDIPIPDSLALIREETITGPDGEIAPLPEYDFLVKPANGLQGQDVAIWKYDSGSKRWSNGETCFDADSLRANLIQLAGEMRGGAIVQGVLKNHPDITPYAPYALSSFRVVSMINEMGTPVVVISTFRTATDAASTVDNYHAGGCFFIIDLESGLFGQGYQGHYSTNESPLEFHPANGVRITGMPVPGLEHILALAVRAHEHLPDIPCIGWDIANTDTGFVVVEANVPPGLSPIQQVAIGGFSQTRYMALIGYHCKRWIEETEPEQSRFRVGADLEQ